MFVSGIVAERVASDGILIVVDEFDQIADPAGFVLLEVVGNERPEREVLHRLGGRGCPQSDEGARVSGSFVRGIDHCLAVHDTIGA